MGLPTPYSFTDPLNPTPNPALESDEARVEFWEKQAQRLTWAEPWHTAHRFEKPKSLGFDEDGIEQFTIPERRLQLRRPPRGGGPRRQGRPLL